jgi:hypothetical protein
VEPVVIEPAVELPASFDSSERWRRHGRLILRAEALYFIHGWDEQGVDLWRALDPLVRRLGGGKAPEARAGQRMLAEYASRSAAQQAEVVPGSRVITREDIDRATVRGLAPTLIVETKRHGDRLVFRIPRRARESAKRWAGLGA